MKTTLIANELKSVQPLPLPPSGSLYYIDYVYTKPYSITYPDGMVVIHLKKKKIDNKIILQEDSLTRYVADMEYMKKQMMESCGIPKKFLDDSTMENNKSFMEKRTIEWVNENKSLVNKLVY